MASVNTGGYSKRAMAGSLAPWMKRFARSFERKYLTLKSILMTVILFAFAMGNAQGAMVWDWQFAGESGQFVTDGSDYAGGTYTITEFIVLQSAEGMPTGSMGDGTYIENTYAWTPPFFFVWDGTMVTDWGESATGSLYIAFQRNSPGWPSDQPNYFFGLQYPSTFNPALASIASIGGYMWWGNGGVLTVTPGAAVPLPMSLWLLVSGLLGMMGILRSKQASAQGK